MNLAAGDATGANWRCLWFTRDDGSPPTVATQAQMETASITTFPVTPGRVQYHPGVAKCWAYITVSASTPTLAASHNITSIADTALGRCTVPIATDFSSVNWCSQVTGGGSASTGNGASYTSKAAGTIELRNYLEGQPGGLNDPDSYDFTGHGDQAQSTTRRMGWW